MVGSNMSNPPQGPENWSTLDAANGLCATGTRQSPINMAEGQFHMVGSSDVALEVPDLAAGEAELENLGTTVEVVLEGKGGALTLAGVEYELKQFHVHHPSEHLDDGASVESGFPSSSSCSHTHGRLYKVNCYAAERPRADDL